jgi:hypothetical protein
MGVEHAVEAVYRLTAPIYELAGLLAKRRPRELDIPKPRC